jgi:predicted amino acid-binding ACT domain protein
MIVDVLDLLNKIGVINPIFTKLSLITLNVKKIKIYVTQCVAVFGVMIKPKKNLKKKQLQYLKKMMTMMMMLKKYLLAKT